MTFKTGDKIRCTSNGYSYITEGKTYEVLEVHKGNVYVYDDDGDRVDYPAGDFSLETAALAPSKLNLPFTIEVEASSYKYVLTTGKPGWFTLVDADTGIVYKDHATEDDAIRLLGNGTWLYRGRASAPRAVLVKAVEDAKAALAAAEEALAADKPYLA